MDQHPIPQDVTGFQFKLIGSMTVKQFGYIAVGVVSAVVLYYMPLPGFFGVLIKVIFIPLFGGSGAFIAFVPIDGRPVDVMATNFFKAIFSPNQYIYHKQGRKFSFSSINVAPIAPTTEATQAPKAVSASTMKQNEISEKEARLRAYLQSSHSEVKTSLDQKELAKMHALGLPSAPVKSPTAVPAAAPTTAHKPLPQPQAVAPKPKIQTPVLEQKPVPHTPAAPTAVSQQEQTLAQQESALQQQLQTAKQEETTTHAPAAHEKVTHLEKELQEIHAQKQQLEQELLKLKTQLSNQAPMPVHATPIVAPAVAVAPVSAPVQTPAATQQVAPQAAPVSTVAPQTAPAAGIPASQYAKTLAPAAPKKADLPNISDTPNVVVGIVKDPRGNILPNMLVEVKDKDGNPVRAFKTNPLGQFASATPLTKGIYTIELDDPKKQHSFDVIQITANNQIMLPIEIISHDAREALRQQLFN